MSPQTETKASVGFKAADQDNKFIKNKYIILVYEQETLLRIITK
jgi:hypothetical protein